MVRIFSNDWLDVDTGKTIFGIDYRHPIHGLVHTMVKKNDGLYHPFCCGSSYERASLMSEIEKLKEIDSQLVSGVLNEPVFFIKRKS